MKREEIIRAVKECTEKLGHVPSHVELMRLAEVSRKQVRRHFGTYAALLAECNMKGTGSGYKATMEDLFRDWAGLARALKKVPTIMEYELRGQHSVRPLVLRFGAWSQVAYAMKLYAEEQGRAEEWKDVLDVVAAREEQDKAKGAFMSARGPDDVRRARRFAARQRLEHAAPGPRGAAKATEGREVYGGLMNLGPMVCAPTNEQGVLFLFGAMAEGLGFAVLKIGTEYPDCEAFRVVEGGRLERVKIEFEYESKNFLLHMHEASKADMIVCWKHNWPECPLEVIELGAIWRSSDRERQNLTADKR